MALWRSLTSFVIGDCYSSSRELLRVELRQSGIGAWQVQVVDREQNRRIDSRFEDEAAARQATETAYRYGRQFGRFNIQRASGYQPQGATVSPAGWEPDPG